MFELCDALLCTDGPVRTLVDLALAPEYRRGHGALYSGINHGRIDVARLRRALTGVPLPRAGDGRLVLAVDVSPWLRPTPTPPRTAPSAIPSAGVWASIRWCPVSEAAQAVGMTEAAVMRFALRDPGFAARLEKARERLCRKRPDCGSGTGWRSGRRGLSCWQQHRDARSSPPAGPRGRARAEDAARALGYAGSTPTSPRTPTSAKRVAAALGVSHASVRRWRQER